MAFDLTTLLDGLMADSDQAADEVVYAFMREARRRAGGPKRLAHIAAVGTARDGGYSEMAASSWSKDPLDRTGKPAKMNEAPASVIVAMLRAFPDMSFDQFARGQVSETMRPDTALHARVDRLEREFQEWIAFIKGTLIVLGQASGSVDVEEMLDKFVREFQHPAEGSEDVAEERGS